MTNPTHLFSETSDGYTITLTAFSNAGCLDTHSVTIHYKGNCEFFIPNSFSPDGNEVNETFKPIISENSGIDVTDYTLLIYDRWGELLFESHDVSVGWDGTYGDGQQNRIVQNGTYMWKLILKAFDEADHKIFVGKINLLR